MICALAVMASAQTTPKNKTLASTSKVKTENTKTVAPMKGSSTASVQSKEKVKTSATAPKKTAMLKPKHKHHKVHKATKPKTSR